MHSPPQSRDNRRTALIIGSVWPEPRSSAAGTYIMQLIAVLQRSDWRIVFASTAQPGAVRADLASLGIDEQPIAVNCSSFDLWINTLNPQLVLFDRFMIEEQFGWRVELQCPQTLRVLITQDLHTLRETRRAWLKQTHQNDAVCTTDDSTLFALAANTDLALREVAAIYRSDLSLMVSGHEIQWLTQYFGVPATLLCHTPFLLTIPDQKNWPDFSQRAHFVTIGNFLHPPNWDAVLWLKQTLWPLIRSHLPQAELHVYGAYTPDKARALHNARDGFHIDGWTDDAMQVLQSARVCLAPLRFGAGIKGKLADAMLCGTPSVTTRIGAEAMHAHFPWPGAIADGAAEFAYAAAMMHEDETRWQEAQQQCLTVLQHCFEETRIGAALIATLEAALETRGERRLHNVTGALLRHHLHKSTHYMSRWIESKNQLARLGEADRGEV